MTELETLVVVDGGKPEPCTLTIGVASERYSSGGFGPGLKTWTVEIDRPKTDQVLVGRQVSVETRRGGDVRTGQAIVEHAFAIWPYIVRLTLRGTGELRPVQP